MGEHGIHLCECQRIILWMWFTLPTFPWVPGSCGKYLYPLSHFTSLRDSWSLLLLSLPCPCSHLQAYAPLFSPMIHWLEKFSITALFCPPPQQASLRVLLLALRSQCLWLSWNSLTLDIFPTAVPRPMPQRLEVEGWSSAWFYCSFSCFWVSLFSDYHHSSPF